MPNKFIVRVVLAIKDSRKIIDSKESVFIAKAVRKDKFARLD